MSVEEQWVDRIRMAHRHKDQWRRAALLQGACLLSSMFVVGTLARQPRLVPYYVDLSDDGRVVSIVSPEQSRSRPKEQIEHALRAFVRALRGVTPDIAVQQEWTSSALRTLAKSHPGRNKVLRYLKEHNPADRAKTESVEVAVHSALPVAGNTWEVEWSEKRWRPNGDLIEEISMKAMVHIGFVDPRSEEELWQNPVGLVVKDISWTKRE